MLFCLQSKLIYIQPISPGSLERTSIHTNLYDNGLFNPHQFNT